MFVINATDYAPITPVTPPCDIIPIFIGYKGENKARCLVFDLNDCVEEFGEGNFVISFIRHGDEQPYIVTDTDQLDYTAIWEINSTDTAVEGYGIVQLQYIVDETVCKTAQYRTVTFDSNESAGDVPDPYENLLDQIAAYAASAQGSATAAASSAATAASEAAAAVAPLQAQLDEAIAGVTVDSEVINARVDENGTTYATLGQRLNTEFGDLKNELYVNVPILRNPERLLGNTNPALTNNNDGTYTVGTTDYGNSTFGYSLQLEAGNYWLYGVPNGIAFVTVNSTGSSSYSGRVAENTGAAKKLITIENAGTYYVGFRSPSRPASSYVISPALTKDIPTADLCIKQSWDYLPSNTDINTVTTPGIYFLGSARTYSNKPNFSDGTLLIVSKINTVILQCALNYGIRIATFTPNIAIRWGDGSITSEWKYLGRRFGSRLAFVGDSIVWGRDGNGQATDRTSFNVCDTISQTLGIAVDNYGVSGMGWLQTGDGSVKAYDVISGLTLSDYDGIIISLGVNDGFKDLGTWDSTDEDTIMGQFNKCIQYIMTNKPKMRVIIIAPINGRNVGVFPDYWYGPRNNQYGYVSRKVLSDTLKQACEYYWLPYIEQYDGPINPYSIDTLIGTDGVHPSNAGYIALGQWMASKIGGLL